MPIELRQLHYFRYLARSLSFSRAADEASISQSSMSEQIKRLEDLLGTRLVDRTHRSIRLTLAGEALRDEVDAVLGQIDEMVDRVRSAGGVARSTIKIGYSEMAVGTVMPAILHIFRERHPAIEMVLREQSSIGAERALLNGEFDCVFVPGDRPPPNISHIDLGTEPVLLCVASTSPFAHTASIEVADLRDQPMILPDEGSKLTRYIRSQFALAQIEPKIIARSDHALSIMTLVASEEGAGFIPASLAGLAPAGVIVRPIGNPALQIPFSMLWCTNNSGTELDCLISIALKYRSTH